MNERLEAPRLTRLSYKQADIGFVEAYKLEGVFSGFCYIHKRSINQLRSMRKKYCKPRISVEKLDFPLLVETSYIRVGGTGSFDAKGCSDDFYDEEEE